MTNEINLNFINITKSVVGLLNSIEVNDGLAPFKELIINLSLFSFLVFLVFFVVSTIYQTLSIQSFDIKIQHKNEQSRFYVSKFLSVLVIITVYFLILQSMFAVAINGITWASNGITLITALLFLLIIALTCNWMIHDTIVYFRNKKSKNNKKGSSVNKSFLDSSYSLFTNKSKEVAIIILAIMTLLLCSLSTHSIIFGSTGDPWKELSFILIFTLTLSIILIVYMWSKNKKTEYIFLGIQEEKPNLRLFLDHKLNGNTTVLHNENKTLYVVRKDSSGKITYELFQIFKDNSTSEKKK